MPSTGEQHDRGPTAPSFPFSGFIFIYSITSLLYCGLVRISTIIYKICPKVSTLFSRVRPRWMPRGSSGGKIEKYRFQQQTQSEQNRAGKGQEESGKTETFAAQAEGGGDGKQGQRGNAQ